jgi:DNA-binding LacI/PurR family transcriptional regulator/biotin operon repressor
MEPFCRLSTSEQLAGHLRRQIENGTLKGAMPGVQQLAKTLGVNSVAVGKAVQQLEHEGLVLFQGARKCRRVAQPRLSGKHTAPRLQVQILRYAPDDSKFYYNVDAQHRLMEAGHSVRFASKSLVELGMNTERIARFVSRSPADAWLVISGSREALLWFSQQEIPTFALAGRRRGIEIASTGPDKVPALRTAVRRLVELGHKRIVMLAREVRRKPEPGEFEQVFLDELAACGIQHGPYNLPDWRESAEGLRGLLASLFQHTPPTALIIEEAHTFLAAQQYLTQRGIVAPDNVSLICDDPDPAFAWFRPMVAHIGWDGSQWARRIVRWADNVASGKDDRHRSFTKAAFIEGGTIGPAPSRVKRID